MIVVSTAAQTVATKKELRTGIRLTRWAAAFSILRCVSEDILIYYSGLPNNSFETIINFGVFGPAKQPY